MRIPLLKLQDITDGQRLGIQQTHTADVKWNLEWKGNALFDDGSGERFTDKDFHAYLRKSGIEQESGKNNEWFHVTGQESKIKFYDFRANHGILQSLSTVVPYQLRSEQEDAVDKTIAYKNIMKMVNFCGTQNRDSEKHCLYMISVRSQVQRLC